MGLLRTSSTTAAEILLLLTHCHSSFTPPYQLQKREVMAAVAKLRELLAHPGYIVCPGVYDGISTRAALQYDPQVLYASGAGMTGSRLGLPDLAYATQDDFVSSAGMIASCDRSVPVIADAEVRIHI